MISDIKTRKQQLATEYAMVNANPILKTLIQVLVMLLDLAFMLMVIWYVFALFLPFGSWFNLVDGRSMEPTLHDRQIMFSDMSEIERGDIVTSRFPREARLMYPESEDSSMIKRVIAVSGDKLIITKDAVYVNDQLLDEYYLTEDNKRATYMADSDYNAILLEEGEYFLMGDNRMISYDSRIFGVVTEDDILYKQSTKLTPNFFVKLAIIVALFIADIFIYMLMEFILTESIYGLIYGRKIKEQKETKKTTETIELKGDNV